VLTVGWRYAKRVCAVVRVRFRQPATFNPLLVGVVSPQMTTATDQPKRGAMNVRTSADHVGLAAFYRDITDPNGRAMLDFLIDHPGERFEARQIMEALGFAQHRDVGLAAYAVGEVARKHGQPRPWLEAQLGYTMSPDVAGELRQARDARHVMRDA
jgi:hypothetical protein